VSASVSPSTGWAYSAAVQVQVALGVHRALGAAGGAGGVEPEGGFIGQGLRRLGLCGAACQHGLQILQGHAVGVGQCPGGSRHQQVAHFVRTLRQGLLQRRHQGPGDQCRLGPAVAQHVAVVLGGEQGVEGHRHDAGVQGAQEAGDPVIAVVHQQQHTLLAPQAQGAQGIRGAADALGHLPIAELTEVVDQGRLVAAPGIAADQVLGKVEFGRRCDRGVGSAHGVVSSAGVQ